MNNVKVLIVEDDPLIAEDIREILTNSHYEVVGVAHTKSAALSLLKEASPDIVLLDINLGNEMAGFDIAHKINDLYQIPFIYLTAYSGKAVVTDAKHTHPMGYIVKPFDENDLYAAIEVAMFNHRQKSRPRYFSRTALNKKLLSELTEKEYEILQDIYEGYSNKQMADKHYVSINTIKTHIQKIYAKLDTHSRISTVAKLRELLD